MPRPLPRSAALQAPSQTLTGLSLGLFLGMLACGPADAAGHDALPPSAGASIRDAVQARGHGRPDRPAASPAPGSASSKARERAVSLTQQRLKARTEASEATEPTALLTVQPKDTVIGLSRHVLAYPKAWTEVAVFNRLPDANRIQVSQALRIPLRLLKYQRQRAEILHVSGAASLDGGPVRAGDAWEEGQVLATGEGASVQVRLADQTELRVMPRSMARLGRHRDYAAQARLGVKGFEGQIELQAGTVETLAAKGAQRAAPLLVKTPTVAIGVRGTSYRVHHDLLATTRSEVLEGRVQADLLISSEGGTPLLGDQGTRHQTGERQLQARALPARPDLSAWPAQIRQGQATLPLPGGQRHRILVAQDPAMLDTVLDLDVDGGPAALSLETLGLGTWHVRVQALDDWGLASQDVVRPVQVLPPVAAPVTPLQAGPQASVVKSSEAGVELVWPAAQVSGRVSYEVQLLGDAEGVWVLRQSEVTAPAWTVKPPQDGKAFFRYRIRSAQGNSPWSPIQPLGPGGEWRKWVPFLGV